VVLKSTKKEKLIVNHVSKPTVPKKKRLGKRQIFEELFSTK
jgi:hypothetical protein